MWSGKCPVEQVWTRKYPPLSLCCKKYSCGGVYIGRGFGVAFSNEWEVSLGRAVCVQKGSIPGSRGSLVGNTPRGAVWQQEVLPWYGSVCSRMCILGVQCGGRAGRKFSGAVSGVGVSSRSAERSREGSLV